MTILTPLSSCGATAFRQSLCVLSFPFFLLGCEEQRATDPSSGAGQESVGPVFAGGSITPQMTEEGCQLTPSCSGDGGEEARSTIVDPNLSYVTGDVASPPDPSPGADGIWLGIDAAYCYLPYSSQPIPLTDRDNDGLRDICELILAQAFAPLLSMSPEDDCPGGEPYWAAKYFNNIQPYNWGDFVRIAYLQSYYLDCGTLGHSGDSELIQLTVAYVPNTQHWRLINSWISAHAVLDGDALDDLAGEVGSNSSTWGTFFQWPSGRAYSWPRVYISPNKHGNYRSKNDCASGGAFFGFGEDCSYSVDAGRIRVFKSRNLGSARYSMNDCVVSANLSNGVQECYWTGGHFGGWQPDGGEESARYSAFLNSPVYACFMYAAGSYWCSSWGF